MLEEVKVTKEMDRETLVNVARTSLRTKVHTELADLLTEVRLSLSHTVSFTGHCVRDLKHEVMRDDRTVNTHGCLCSSLWS